MDGARPWSLVVALFIGVAGVACSDEPRPPVLVYEDVPPPGSVAAACGPVPPTGPTGATDPAGPTVCDDTVGPWDVDYRLAEGAAAPATSALAYEVRPLPGLTSSDIAAVLGVAADAVEVGDGGRSFTHRDPATPDQSPHFDESQPCPGDRPCPAHGFPMLEGAPPADVAEARLRRWLGGVGLEPDAGTIDVAGTYGYRVATFHLEVDGIPTGARWFATFGAHDRLYGVSGDLVTYEPIGRYPLVGLAEAVDRIEHQYSKRPPGAEVDPSGPDRVVEVTGAALAFVPARAGADGRVVLAPGFALHPEGGVVPAARD